MLSKLLIVFGCFVFSLSRYCIASPQSIVDSVNPDSTDVIVVRSIPETLEFVRDLECWQSKEFEEVVEFIEVCSDPSNESAYAKVDNNTPFLKSWMKLGSLTASLENSPFSGSGVISLNCETLPILIDGCFETELDDSNSELVTEVLAELESSFNSACDQRIAENPFKHFAIKNGVLFFSSQEQRIEDSIERLSEKSRNQFTQQRVWKLMESRFGESRKDLMIFNRLQKSRFLLATEEEPASQANAILRQVGAIYAGTAIDFKNTIRSGPEVLVNAHLAIGVPMKPAIRKMLKEGPEVEFPELPSRMLELYFVNIDVESFLAGVDEVLEAANTGIKKESLLAAAGITNEVLEKVTSSFVGQYFNCLARGSNNDGEFFNSIRVKDRVVAGELIDDFTSKTGAYSARQKSSSGLDVWLQESGPSGNPKKHGFYLNDDFAFLGTREGVETANDTFGDLRSQLIHSAIDKTRESANEEFEAICGGVVWPGKMNLDLRTIERAIEFEIRRKQNPNRVDMSDFDGEVCDLAERESNELMDAQVCCRILRCLIDEFGSLAVLAGRTENGLQVVARFGGFLHEKDDE